LLTVNTDLTKGNYKEKLTKNFTTVSPVLESSAFQLYLKYYLV